MSESIASMALFSLTRLLVQPRRSLKYIWSGFLQPDRIFSSQVNWSNGSLPRVALDRVLGGASEIGVAVPRAIDRLSDLSITLEEACCLYVIEKHLKARKVLEIGTYDGNTTLGLAANLEPQGEVVTVDLPPDFDLQKMSRLPDARGYMNLTPREQLGRQFRDNPLRSSIRQVYGDSANLDWQTLGGPFDLVFIDGCHSEAYVESDTRNAIKVLARPGAIVWHDYAMMNSVCSAVDRLAPGFADLKVCSIEGTRLAIGLR